MLHFLTDLAISLCRPKLACGRLLRSGV